MTITIKTAADIEGMRLAGRLASEVLDMLTPHMKARHHHRASSTAGARPHGQRAGRHPGHAELPAAGLPGLPGVAVHLAQPQVCHGIPDDRPLKNGDIVNIDVTVIKDGWHGDNSRMFVVGEGSASPRGACARSPSTPCGRASSRSPGRAPGRHRPRHPDLRRNAGFSVVREFCGHGIGARFHEEPQVLHYGRPGTLENWCRA
jgi:methionyl aminopeptidase